MYYKGKTAPGYSNPGAVFQIPRNRSSLCVSAPAGGGAEMVDWVIGEPSPADRKLLLEAANRAIDAAERIVADDGDCQKAMNLFN